MIPLFLLIVFRNTFCDLTSKTENEDLFANKKGCLNVSVILVPGLCASQLTYTLTPKENAGEKVTRGKSLWIDPLKLIIGKYKDYLKPHYNASTNTIGDHPDIQVDILSQNSTDAVEYLTPRYEFLLEHWSKYYYTISRYLTTNHCFKRNVDLFALPYDFRLITHKPKLEELFTRQRILVENTYARTSKKILFVTHSLGSPLTNMFFNRMTSVWKDKYIQGWFSINGLFSYDIVALGVVTLGDNPFIRYLLPTRDVQHVSNSMPTIYSIMPNPKNAPKSTVIALVDGVEYTVGDLLQLFNITKVPYGREILDLSEPLFECFMHDVNAHFIHSTGFKTKNILTLKKKSDGSYAEGKPQYVDGDGTVVGNSLSPPKHCTVSKKQSTNDKVIEESTVYNVNHINMMFDNVMLDRLTGFLNVINNK